MLINIFALLRRIESEIGNQAKASVRAHETGLELRVYWPDGYIMGQRIDIADLDQIVDEELIIGNLIDKCKNGHPHLAPYIS